MVGPFQVYRETRKKASLGQTRRKSGNFARAEADEKREQFFLPSRTERARVPRARNACVVFFSLGCVCVCVIGCGCVLGSLLLGW